MDGYGRGLFEGMEITVDGDLLLLGRYNRCATNRLRDNGREGSGDMMEDGSDCIEACVGRGGDLEIVVVLFCRYIIIRKLYQICNKIYSES